MRVMPIFAAVMPWRKGVSVIASKPGRKAALCWVALILLSVLNPSPTGGALLIIVPLGVFTYHYTKEYLNDRTVREREAQ